MKVLKAIVQGGPMGLGHALREAWLARRIARVSACMDRERVLHRESMAQLRAEMDSLLLAKAGVVQRAAAFWKELG